MLKELLGNNGEVTRLNLVVSGVAAVAAVAKAIDNYVTYKNQGAS